MQKIMRHIYILVTLLSLGASSACAAAISESQLPPHSMVENFSLQRCSSAPVKALKVFKVGYAAVYMRDCAELTSDFYGSMKQLSFEYHREIPGDAFADAAADFLKKNLSPETWAALEGKINAFNSHYKDIGPGDRYDLVHLAGRELRLLLNGELLASESDALFAQSYFTIWFGEHPFDKTLKSRLLTPPARD